MPAYPDLDESRARLPAAGWFVLWEGRPYRGGGAAYRVRAAGTDRRRVTGEGAAEREAWHRAVRRVVWYGIPS
jgi:hypothetical protein